METILAISIYVPLWLPISLTSLGCSVLYQHLGLTQSPLRYLFLIQLCVVLLCVTFKAGVIFYSLLALWKGIFTDFKGICVSSLAGKGSACNAGDPGLIPGSGRSAGEGIGYPCQYSWASLVAQLVKYLPTMRETWFPSLGWEDHLEKGKAAHSSILA